MHYAQRSSLTNSFLCFCFDTQFKTSSPVHVTAQEKLLCQVQTSGRIITFVIFQNVVLGQSSCITAWFVTQFKTSSPVHVTAQEKLLCQVQTAGLVITFVIFQNVALGRS